MQTDKRSVGRPPVITTEGLTLAADELVRANGLESLTVGQVAQALEVTTRALYHHIEGLRDLHMLVCDRALSTIGNNNAGLSPADATRLMLAELRNVVENYRGLARFILQYGSLSSGIWRIVDLFINQLRAGGLDDERAVNTASMLLSWQSSIVIRQQSSEDETPKLDAIDLKTMPDLASTLPTWERLTHAGLYQFEYDSIVEPVLADLS